MNSKAMLLVLGNRLVTSPVAKARGTLAKTPASNLSRNRFCECRSKREPLGGVVEASPDA
jgi:hypothetical protein